MEFTKEIKEDISEHGKTSLWKANVLRGKQPTFAIQIRSIHKNAFTKIFTKC